MVEKDPEETEGSKKEKMRSAGTRPQGRVSKHPVRLEHIDQLLFHALFVKTDGGLDIGLTFTQVWADVPAKSRVDTHIQCASRHVWQVYFQGQGGS